MSDIMEDEKELTTLSVYEKDHDRFIKLKILHNFNTGKEIKKHPDFMKIILDKYEKVIKDERNIKDAKRV